LPQGEVGEDGRLTAEALAGEIHPLISGNDAVALGLISEGYRTKSMYCAYKFACIQIASAAFIRAATRSPIA